VIFPRLAVGDTVVMTMRLESKAAVFPGHCLDEVVFPRASPRHLSRRAARGRGARRDRAARPRPAAAGLHFKDYQDLGHAYWAEAEKRAPVTPEIRALADEITAGTADRRAQVAAIDRWIKSNVR
jgi:transglutaminase-like putative cysteine protease